MFAREGASITIACMEAERKDAEAVKSEIESVSHPFLRHLTPGPLC